LLFLLLLFY